MTNLLFISVLLQAGFYIYAGVSHFRNPKFFLKITPKWVPSPEQVNLIIGAIEIILGIGLLIPFTRSFAAIGIIILLIVVFPANIYHFQKSLKKGKFVIPTLIRLPVQFLLIYWAYVFV